MVFVILMGDGCFLVRRVFFQKKKGRIGRGEKLAWIGDFCIVGIARVWRSFWRLFRRFWRCFGGVMD
jgi:hypothetical protein